MHDVFGGKSSQQCRDSMTARAGGAGWTARRLDGWTANDNLLILARLSAQGCCLAVTPSSRQAGSARGSPRLSTSNYGIAHNRDVHFVTPASTSLYITTGVETRT
jgi:hypothetical protein